MAAEDFKLYIYYKIVVEQDKVFEGNVDVTSKTSKLTLVDIDFIKKNLLIRAKAEHLSTDNVIFCNIMQIM